MIDIENELKQLKIKEIMPDERLVYQTKMRIQKIMQHSPKPKRKETMPKEEKAKVKLWFKLLPAAAVFLLIAFAVSFAVIPVAKINEGSAFYTIDINPSVEIKVDAKDTIIGVNCKNNDALKLMADIDCIGQNIAAAIPKIVAQAYKLGYIKDNKENYVLVARFGNTQGSVTQSDLDAIVSEAAGAEARVLFLIGTLTDKQDADKNSKPAGIMLLEKEAGKKGIDTLKYQQEKGEVGNIIKDIDQKDYPVPQVSGSSEDNYAVLHWNMIEHKNFLGYKIVASKENNLPKYPDDGYLQYITDAKTTSCKINFDTLKVGESYYFSVTAVYAGNVCIAGNAVNMKVTRPEPNPSPSPPPQPSKDPYPSTTIKGSISGEKVRLSWGKIDHAEFEGYKIVASAANASPKYPEDGYIKYITNPDTTSLSVYEGYGGLKANKSYYFSVTVVYKRDRYVPGNAVHLKVPKKAEPAPEPTQSPPDGEMKASSISGSISDGKVRLSWSKIEHSTFQGYKVVKSYTNSSPKYPDDGYISYITNASTTSVSYDLSKFEQGKTCYFSITVLYSDGTNKAGNAIALTIPESATPDQPMTATSISGSIDAEGKIHLSWGKIDHPLFDGYKVVCAKHANPSYPGDGYKSWITDPDDTSVTYNVSDFDAGATYYFSITVLYDNHNVKKPGNDVAITMPAPSA